MHMMQQKQTCNCEWKQVTNLQQSRSFLIKQSNQQIHQKLNHLAIVPVAVIIIVAIVQEVLIRGQAIAKARITL
jgi:hypothetical protein